LDATGQNAMRNVQVSIDNSHFLVVAELESSRSPTHRAHCARWVGGAAGAKAPEGGCATAPAGWGWRPRPTGSMPGRSRAVARCCARPRRYRPTRPAWNCVRSWPAAAG
jgi:hypothetical protein